MPGGAFVRTLNLDHPPEWAFARCAEDDVNPDIFFPERDGSRLLVKVARNYCRECLIRRTCLEYAMDNHIAHGMWGGFTPKERQEIRKFR